MIRRAAELQEHAGAERTREGVPLSVVREIAVEIGIDPRFVDAAAETSTDSGGSRLEQVLGGPIRGSIVTFHDRSLTDADVRAVVECLRSRFGRHGHLSHSLGSFEWVSKDLTVVLSPGDENTRIEIVGDRWSAVGPTVTVPITLGVIAAAVIVDAVQPGSSGTIATLAAGLAAGLTAARVIWTATTERFRRRLQSVRLEIWSAIEEFRSSNRSSRTPGPR